MHQFCKCNTQMIHTKSDSGWLCSLYWIKCLCFEVKRGHSTKKLLCMKNHLRLFIATLSYCATWHFKRVVPGVKCAFIEAAAHIFFVNGFSACAGLSSAKFFFYNFRRKIDLTQSFEIFISIVKFNVAKIWEWGTQICFTKYNSRLYSEGEKESGLRILLFCYCEYHCGSVIQNKLLSHYLVVQLGV